MKVDLWIAKLDDCLIEDEEILSEEERTRANRFLYPHLKEHYTKRRSILRKMLSRYLEIDPKEIVIKERKLGKPYVSNNGEGIFFNTSHSKEFVLYGFSRESELGVDLEFLNSEIEADLISTHFFSVEEINLIRNSQGREKTEAFFRLWCIKEAYIKLVGKGLTFPLDQVLVKDSMTVPKLEIPLKSSAEKVKEHTCIYSNWIPGFGLGVVVEGKELEIEYRVYS
ncbi:4'-phosphopantetheinyl transferase family protein [Algoriphagus machipongonensis]|uniref:Phosphopantetheinyl transferase n=1 Tax=Algoriphagus machipongonensis TaxID=388413 RepID=A3HT11_9BACT|nr:4'-phosphopantetheinyl transferase superfamily protein [Algoriphagus machipongonensis]EAZ82979.1 phosphopantetheinyl transferase [Algoriphagus machipongonensis]